MFKDVSRSTKLPETMEQLREAARGPVKMTRYKPLFFDETKYLTNPLVDANADGYYLYDVGECKAAVERLDYQKRMEIESLDIAILSDAFTSHPNHVTFVFEYTNSSSGSWNLMETGFEVYEPGIPWRVHVFHVSQHFPCKLASAH